ncbi:MAG TPA: glycosyltransferase family 2 protein [Candidatus Saccharibacteria bacterium]|nr:glycosyltransferase family 2 protein [Candidatus Saccharibacteria bacterium]
MSKSTNGKHKPVVVIPNLNGGDALLKAIESLRQQTLKPHIIVTDNASTDGSLEKAQDRFSDVEFICNQRNRGYTGGVNPGFERSIELGAKYVAPFNDDAIADKKWLMYLVRFLDENPLYGAACPKVLKSDATTIDSTGDYLTSWGLPYPRGRNETDNNQYDQATSIFSASGAASLYRVAMLEKVGLLDQSFFAYYEDIDLSFRMQNQGWKVGYVPEAVVYHAVGMTSSRMKGFTTYQTMKNQPLLLWKNLPASLLLRVLPRFYLAYILFFFRALTRGHGWYAIRGVFMSVILLFWKLPDILMLETKRKVSSRYIWSMIVHDLPPNATALRTLRLGWRKLLKK